MKYLILLLIVISTIGCMGGHAMWSYKYTQVSTHTNPIRTIPIIVDKQFGDSDRIEIASAVDQWNYALNGFIQLKVENWNFDLEPKDIYDILDRRGFIFLKLTSDSFLIPSAVHGGNTVAFANRVGGNLIYLIRDRLHNEDVKYVMMHEIGHLMGTDHIGNDLMSPIYHMQNYQCIDKVTMEAIAAYQQIPFNKVNYCVYY